MTNSFKLIRVDDRLPEPFTKVIARSSYGHLGIAFWDGRDWIDATTMETLGGKWVFLCFTGYEQTITHWLEFNHLTTQ
jgi:hypothetical protein